MATKINSVVAPCCVGCPSNEACARDELACGSFYAYVNDSSDARRYGRQPNREWFAATFVQEDAVAGSPEHPLLVIARKSQSPVEPNHRRLLY